MTFTRGLNTRGKPIYTKTNWDTIKDMLLEGKTTRVIAEELGIARNTVSHAACKMGITIPRGRRRLAPLQIRHLPGPANLLAELLEEVDLKWLAEKSGYDYVYLVKYRRRTQVPSLTTLIDLLQALGYELRPVKTSNPKLVFATQTTNREALAQEKLSEINFQQKVRGHRTTSGGNGGAS